MKTAAITPFFTMSFPNPASHTAEIASAFPSKGPEAHEDLTIAEHIQSMRLGSSDCPGESCFINQAGKKCWITDGVVERFIRKSGAMHPSDYQAKNGEEWQSSFFKET